MKYNKNASQIEGCPCYPFCDQMMGQMRPMNPRPYEMPSYMPNPYLMQQMSMQQPPMQQMPTQPMQYIPESKEEERDRDRMLNMYPRLAREIQQNVENACDDMDFEGSFIYDEQPDKTQLYQVRNQIFEQMQESYPVEEEEDRDELFAMNKESRRRYPPGQNWLNDFIETMLYQEIFRRRCRRRNCRQWY